MKKLFFKKSSNAKLGRKSLSVMQKLEDRETKTRVHKHFVYNVEPTSDTEDIVTPPQVYIRKAVNSQLKEEKFNFQVKGYFFVTHQGQGVRVHFHHTLDIRITWKGEFSPKKSEILTQ